MVALGWILGLSFLGALPQQEEPDLSKMIRLSNESTLGHACPLGMETALTNRHVMSGGEFMWGVGDGEEFHGLVQTDASQAQYTFRDLVRIYPSTPQRFPGWYTVALKAPKIGDKVFLTSYDWENEKKAFLPKTIEAKVTGVDLGKLLFAPKGAPGSSGGCILNAQGEVLAINKGGVGLENNTIIGVGIAIWGDWLKFGPERPKEEEPSIFPPNPE